MERYRYIIAVFTHEANRRQAAAVRQSWGAQLPPSTRLLFIYGNADEAMLTGDELHLPCPESYAQLPAKVLAAIRYLHDNFDFDYLVKADDDTYFRPEIVLTPEYAADYIGFFQEEKILPRWHYTKVPPNLQQPYQGDVLYPFARGMFYLLSHRAVEQIAMTDDNVIPELNLPIGYEDVMVGNILGAKDQFSRIDLENTTAGKYIWHPVDPSLMTTRPAEQWTPGLSLSRHLPRWQFWRRKLRGKWQRLMTDLKQNKGRYIRLKLRSLFHSDLSVYTRSTTPTFPVTRPVAVIAEPYLFAYLPIPCAGQQEIEAALAMLLNLPHSKTHTNRIHFTEATLHSSSALPSYYKTWTCVRNPWDRLLVAFEMTDNNQNSFDHFIEECCNTTDEQAPAYCRSQVSLLTDAVGTICADTILKYDKLPDALNQLSNEHGWPEIYVQTLAAPHPERMTPDLAAKIGKRYCQDIDMFGFKYLQNN